MMLPLPAFVFGWRCQRTVIALEILLYMRYKYWFSKYLGRHSQVAKATVCKTVIPGFKSRCRLQPYALARHAPQSQQSAQGERYLYGPSTASKLNLADCLLDLKEAANLVETHVLSPSAIDTHDPVPFLHTRLGRR